MSYLPEILNNFTVTHPLTEANALEQKFRFVSIFLPRTKQDGTSNFPCAMLINRNNYVSLKLGDMINLRQDGVRFKLFSAPERVGLLDSLESVVQLCGTAIEIRSDSPESYAQNARHIVVAQDVSTVPTLIIPAAQTRLSATVTCNSDWLYYGNDTTSTTATLVKADAAWNIPAIGNVYAAAVTGTILKDDFSVLVEF